MFPRMWAATGVDYPALVDRLITLTLDADRIALSVGAPAVLYGSEAVVDRLGQLGDGGAPPCGR